MDPRKVFVTSLPAYLTEEKLQRIFQEHAKVISIDLRKNKNMSYSKGYGVLTLANKSEVKKLLGQQIYIKDRLVILQPCLKGKKLKKWQKKVKECRVIIKNIPSSVSDRQLHKIFSKFGKVISAFCSATHQARKPHGFVTFDCKEGAQKCLDQKKIPIKGKGNIHCEKFDEKIKRIDRLQKEKDLKRKSATEIEIEHAYKPSQYGYHKIERNFKHYEPNLSFFSQAPRLLGIRRRNLGRLENLLEKRFGRFESIFNDFGRRERVEPPWEQKFYKM